MNLSAMTTYDFAIITPCFNENETAVRFLRELESVLQATPYRFVTIIVNDSSTDNTGELLDKFEFTASNLSKKTLHLKYNLGHQGAIYQGLLFADTLPADRFIVIDSDGEDDPAAILELIEEKSADIVFVSRGKRRESLKFKAGYFIFQMLFKLITGHVINFGNYSMINRKILQAVKDSSFINYAAFLSRQKAKIRKIQFDRRKRIDGQSKMNMQSLFLHGFNSFIEYSEDLLMVFLKFFLILGGVFLCSLMLVLYVKLFTHDAVPGWASILSVSLFNSMLICLGFFTLGLMKVNLVKKGNHIKRALYDTPREAKAYAQQEADFDEILKH